MKFFFALGPHDWDLFTQIKLQASRSEFGPKGWDSCLEAWRLKIKPSHWNLCLATWILDFRLGFGARASNQGKVSYWASRQGFFSREDPRRLLKRRNFLLTSVFMCMIVYLHVYLSVVLCFVLYNCEKWSVPAIFTILLPTLVFFIHSFIHSFIQ